MNTIPRTELCEDDDTWLYYTYAPRTELCELTMGVVVPGWLWERALRRAAKRRSGARTSYVALLLLPNDCRSITP